MQLHIFQPTWLEPEIFTLIASTENFFSASNREMAQSRARNDTKPQEKYKSPLAGGGLFSRSFAMAQKGRCVASKGAPF